MNEDNNQNQLHVPEEPLTSDPSESTTTQFQQTKSETQQLEPLASPVVVHHRKSKKPLIIIIAILLVALGAGLAYWYLTNSANNESKKAVTVTVKKDAVKKAPQSEVEKVLAAVSAATGGGEVKPYGYATYYQVNGYDFSATVGSEVTRRLSYAVEPNQAEAMAKKIETALLKEGFTVSKQQVKPELNDFNLTKYESQTTVCSINYSEGMTSTDGEDLKGAADIACAPKAAYKANSEIQKPFYDAYRAEDVHGGEGVLGLPKISESKTQGYKFAEASIGFEGSAGGAAGLFYMTPDKAWHYFRSSQQLLLCSDYNTAELKKAFLGERCYIGPTAEESVVKL